MHKKNSNISFEEAMQKLEDSVLKLESSNLTLNESISEFEKAIGFIKLCEEELSMAKQKVKILTESADGSVTDLPFEALGDDET